MSEQVDLDALTQNLRVQADDGMTNVSPMTKTTARLLHEAADAIENLYAPRPSPDLCEQIKALDVRDECGTEFVSLRDVLALPGLRALADALSPQTDAK